MALKTVGFRCASPDECKVLRMTTWLSWRQLTRWQRGALEDLRTYGMHRGSARRTPPSGMDLLRASPSIADNSGYLG